jgi:hypothetical protein
MDPNTTLIFIEVVMCREQEVDHDLYKPTRTMLPLLSWSPLQLVVAVRVTSDNKTEGGHS